MAWSIRSLSEASSAIRGAFRQHLPGTDTSLKNNFVTVVVKVLAGIAHEFELRMGWLSRQIFLVTATDERWIRLHCASVGIYQKPASVAAGTVEGTGAPSTTYPSGIRLVSGEATYVTTDAATSAGDGSISFPVVSEGKGSAMNRDAGGQLSLADPGLYPDLSTVFEVSSVGLGGGADIEDLDALKVRGLERKRNPPGGGTLSDYERIAIGVPGVIKAWAFRVTNAPGMVVVHFLFSGRTNSIPEASDVLVVQAAIDAKRLIRVDDSVAVAPIAYTIDVEIDGLDQDTAEIRAAIEDAVAAVYLSRCRPSVVGNLFTVSRSWYSEAISTVTGEERHTLVLPSSDITVPAGKFPVNGSFTYGA